MVEVDCLEMAFRGLFLLSAASFLVLGAVYVSAGLWPYLRGFRG